MTAPDKRAGSAEIGACEVTLADRARQFWLYLEKEPHVRVLVDMRRDTSSVPYWDSSSFGNDVAKELVADRDRLTSENASLRAKLEPFAKLADHWRWGRQMPSLALAVVPATEQTCDFTIADLRNAREALRFASHETGDGGSVQSKIVDAGVSK